MRVSETVINTLQFQGENTHGVALMADFTQDSFHSIWKTPYGHVNKVKSLRFTGGVLYWYLRIDTDMLTNLFVFFVLCCVFCFSNSHFENTPFTYDSPSTHISLNSRLCPLKATKRNLVKHILLEKYVDIHNERQLEFMTLSCRNSVCYVDLYCDVWTLFSWLVTFLADNEDDYRGILFRVCNRCISDRYSVVCMMERMHFHINQCTCLHCPHNGLYNTYVLHAQLPPWGLFSWPIFLTVTCTETSPFVSRVPVE